MHIHEQMLLSPHLTLDPAKADLFLVPFYSSCYMSSNFVKPGPGWPDNDVDIGKTLLASSQVLKHIKAAYRNTTRHCSCLLWFHFISSDAFLHNAFAAYWDAKAGFDHVWTFTSDVISLESFPSPVSLHRQPEVERV